MCAGTAVSAAGPIRMLMREGDPKVDAAADTAKSRARISRGRGTWTSFGSVAVLGAARGPRHDAAAHAAHHENRSDPRSPLVNRTWTDSIRAEIEVHNGAARPVMLSPGQFRLQVGADGTTVSPYDVGRPPAAIPPGQTVTTWIEYLAPAEESEFSLVYDDTGLPRPLPFRLTLGAGAGATAGVAR